MIILCLYFKAIQYIYLYLKATTIFGIIFPIQYTAWPTVSYFNRYELCKLFHQKQIGHYTKYDAMPLCEVYTIYNRLCNG